MARRHLRPAAVAIGAVLALAAGGGSGMAGDDAGARAVDDERAHEHALYDGPGSGGGVDELRDWRELLRVCGRYPTADCRQAHEDAVARRGGRR
jgi:hypothetical protein